MTHEALSRVSVLPPSLPPIGVNRVQAAAFVGVSPSFFDMLVSRGDMPKPRKAGGRSIWDVGELAEAFKALPKAGEDAEMLPHQGGNTCAGRFGRAR